MAWRPRAALLALSALAFVLQGGADPGIRGGRYPAAEVPGGAVLSRVASLEEFSPDATPAPTPEDDGVPLIIKKNVGMIFSDLQESPYQYLNAIIALVLGALMVFKGEKIFICGIVYIVASTVAGEQISAQWGLTTGNIIRHVVAFEIGGLGAYAAYKGIDGVMIVIAVCLSVIFAYLFKDLLLAYGAASAFDDKWLLVTLFTVFVALGVYMLIQRRLQHALFAIISPMLGGALLSSALCYGSTAMFLKIHESLQLNLKVDPVGGSWIDFMSLLWSSKNTDVGVFAGHEFNGLPVDCLVSRALWAVLFVFGALFQLHAERAIKRAMQQRVAAYNRGALSTRLLQR